MRRTIKSIRLVAHILFGITLCLWVSVDKDRFLRRERLAMRWHRRLLRILGVHIRRSGTAAPGSRIIVANHVSWLDIPVLAAAEPTRFVSKAEVGEWPVAGWFADGSGTFYLKRGAGATKQLSEALRAFVDGAGLVTFFPEGTTTSGESLLRFQPRLFSIAIDSGHFIQPIALRYAHTPKGGNVAPFIGDDDLLSHVLRLMREPRIEVELVYCAPIASTGMDRGQLAAAAQEAILSVIAPGGQMGVSDRALAA